MKKYIRTYGSMFFYLAFALGMDLTVPLLRRFLFSQFIYILNRWFWIIFPIGSLLYLWYSVKNRNGDKIFYSSQILIGLLGIFSALARFISMLKVFDYELVWLLHVHRTVPFIGLNIALAIVAGIGVVGLIGNKKIDEKGNDEKEF